MGCEWYVKEGLGARSIAEGRPAELSSASGPTGGQAADAAGEPSGKPEKKRIRLCALLPHSGLPTVSACLPKQAQPVEGPAAGGGLCPPQACEP